MGGTKTIAYLSGKGNGKRKKQRKFSEINEQNNLIKFLLTITTIEFQKKNVVLTLDYTH